MNKKFLSIIHLLVVIAICTCSCSKDEQEPAVDTGNIIELHVPIEGINDAANESTATRSAGNQAITVTQELGDGIILESTLTEDTVSTDKTRAGTIPLGNSTIVMIAYRIIKTDQGIKNVLYKSEVFNSSNPKIHLPEGEKFKLVFYSYNTLTEPEINPSGIKSSYEFGDILYGYELYDNEESSARNIIWAKIEETPVIKKEPSTVLESVTFTHLFSQVLWNIQSAAGEISKCNAVLTPTFEKAIVKVGGLVNCSSGERGANTWTGKGIANYGVPIPFTIPATGELTLESEVTTFCPDESKTNTAFNISEITIFGKTFNNTPVSFNKSLKRGMRYNISSKFKRKCTITFKSMDETMGTVSNAGENSTSAWGENLYSKPAPLTGSYYFNGWYSSADGYSSGIPTHSAGKFEIANDMTLTVTMGKETEGYIYAAKFAEYPVGSRWANTNLRYKDGKHSFTEYPWDTTANFTERVGKMYFWPNRWDGTPLEGHQDLTYSTDPCAEVLPKGEWRIPTRQEMEELIIEVVSMPKTNLGYFDIAIRSTAGLHQLQTSGYATYSAISTIHAGIHTGGDRGGYYWVNDNGKLTILNVQNPENTYSTPPYYHFLTRDDVGAMIRCIRSN